MGIMSLLDLQVAEVSSMLERLTNLIGSRGGDVEKFAQDIAEAEKFLKPWFSDSAAPKVLSNITAMVVTNPMSLLGLLMVVLQAGYNCRKLEESASGEEK
jgi:hypothetical protein